MFQHLGHGQELQELELDGSLVYSFKPLLHQPPGACGGALRLWTLVESTTEAAKCWGLRLCLRLKWRKDPGKRSSGKGSRQRLSSREAGVGLGLQGAKGSHARW